MPTNQLAPPAMPWLTGNVASTPNPLGPPLLNYAAPPPDASTSQGAAVADTGQAAWQWLQDQRAESVRQGLLDPNTGLPTQAGLVAAAGQTAQGVMMGTTAPGDVPPPGIVAYHGSPHSFDQFDTSKIGTGEGAQAYGRGLYFAEREGTAQTYRDTLATPLFGGQRYNPDDPTHRASYYVYQRNGGDREAALRELDGEDAGLASRTGADSSKYIVAARQRIAENRALIADPSVQLPEVTDMGSMYQVNIGADPEHFLDWDKPRDALSTNVQAWAKENYPGAWDKAADGSSLYNLIVKQTQSEYPGATKGYMPPPGFNAHAQVTQEMANAGIPGIRYLDQHSRGAGEGTSNYVVFDANTLSILKKYGIAGLIAGGGAAAAGTQQQQPQPTPGS